MGILEKEIKKVFAAVVLVIVSVTIPFRSLLFLLHSAP